MSASHRVLSSRSVSFSTEPVYIDFPRSDGTSERWQSLRTENYIDNDGNVDYYYPVVERNDPLMIKWLSEVGKKVAERLEKTGKTCTFQLLRYYIH